MGARPRTLGAAVVPVVVGTAAAGRADPLRSGLLLVVALGLQVGVNYANDYFDGVRGVDTRERTGPVRLTASKLAAPRAVLSAALLSFGGAAAAGAALALLVDLRLLALGALALLAALGYSGGPRPYAGLGVGELSVFLFFGPVATVGSCYVQSGRTPLSAWWGSVIVGLLAVAILMANNIRDIPTDAAAGKRTLAVRIGEVRSRDLYRSVVAIALCIPVLAVTTGALPTGAIATIVAAPFALRPVRLVRTARGAQLVPVLVGTARLHLVAGLLLAGGIALS